MKILLDTNIIVWALNKDKRLSAEAFKILRDPAHDFYCSIASIWEIAIKLGLGKLKMPDTFIGHLEDNGTKMLAISIEHAYAVRSLPRLHRDPFDRLLVAQAMIEDFSILTHDKQLAAYSVSCVMV